MNGLCQARFPLSLILKVTRGNEVVGIQKHILYIISYKLPWVLRQKIRPFGTLPLFFSLGRALCLPYSSAFLACKYNSFIPLDWPKAVMRESKIYRWSFKVPITKFFLFCHPNLHIKQWRFPKKFFDSVEMRFFNDFSKVFEIVVFRGLPVPLRRIPTGS